MTTRRTGRPVSWAEGIAIRAVWLTWRHLAASRGHDAEFVFWRRFAAKDSNTRDRAGSNGRWVGASNGSPRMSADTYLSSSLLSFLARVEIVQPPDGGEDAPERRVTAEPQAKTEARCWVDVADRLREASAVAFRAMA